MANLAYRGRYYSPPLPRWLYWALIGGMSPFGARACDRIMARYNPAPGVAKPDRTLTGKDPRSRSPSTTSQTLVIATDHSVIVWAPAS